MSFGYTFRIFVLRPFPCCSRICCLSLGFSFPLSHSDSFSTSQPDGLTPSPCFTRFFLFLFHFSLPHLIVLFLSVRLNSHSAHSLSLLPLLPPPSSLPGSISISVDALIRCEAAQRLVCVAIWWPHHAPDVFINGYYIMQVRWDFNIFVSNIVSVSITLGNAIFVFHLLTFICNRL